jgi:hypothetical protein
VHLGLPMVAAVLLWRTFPLAARLALLSVGGVLIAEQMWQLLPLAVGCDFLPLRHAAQALLDGASVYRDPSFVYPPTATPVLLPTAAFSATAAFACWLSVVVAALVLTAAFISRVASPGSRGIVFALVVTALLGSAVTQHSLYAGNLSPLLAPVAVAVLLACERGRWTLGCALLAISLLIKPLLAPLILIPLLSRRWRPLAVTMAPAAAALLVGMAAVPGGSAFPQILWYCLTGSNLHGTEAVNNLSIRGWVEAQHAPAIVGTLTAVCVIAATAIRLLTAEKKKVTPAQLGATILIATFLAGGISEVSYLYVAMSAAMLVSVLPDAHSRKRRWSLIPGIALLASPVLPEGLLGQAWLVVGELLLFAGLLTALPARSRFPSSQWLHRAVVQRVSITPRRLSLDVSCFATATRRARCRTRRAGWGRMVASTDGASRELVSTTQATDTC